MIGSLTDLSRRSGMPSEVTLRKMIARDPAFPVIRHGTHGRKYQIDLDAAVAFVLAAREAPKISRETRSQLIRDLGLSMLAAKAAERG